MEGDGYPSLVGRNRPHGGALHSVLLGIERIDARRPLQLLRLDRRDALGRQRSNSGWHSEKGGASTGVGDPLQKVQR